MSTRYLVSRLGQMLVVMWIVSTIVFFVFRVLPGDQATVLLGLDQSEAARQALGEELGLDRPFLVQYWDWLVGLLSGDLGVAYSFGRVPVAALLGGALLRSGELAAVAMIIGVSIALPMGVVAAVRVGSWADHTTRVIAVIGFALPSFWLGILLLLVFSNVFSIFPSGGYVPFFEDPLGHLHRLTLPAITVGVITTGVLVRFLRSSMVETLQEDYIRTARAKGLVNRRINYKHALRNSALSFVTVAGIQFGLLLGGMVVVEQVFSWPGIGWLTVQALHARDYAVVQGAVLAAAAVFVFVNTAVDISYTVLDPRIRRD